MRTILFITQNNSSAALAKRIQDSGDKVLVESNLFEGTLFNPEVFKRVVRENPELVIIDSNFEASPSVKIEFEKMGIPVYGSSLLSKSAFYNPRYVERILNINGLKTEDIPETSIPITYSVILNGKKDLAVCLFFEYWRFMNEDKGPKAFMGSIGYYGEISIISNKMYSMVQALIKAGFSGRIDFLLHLEKDIWCSGMNFYFSWNTIYNFLENINLNPSELFYGLSMNLDMDLKFKSKWGCQINCGVPPFPYTIFKDNQTMIKGIDSNNSKHLWIMNFNTGELLCATGRGNYVREAKRRAYRTLSNIQADDIMYRTDIGLDTVDVCRKMRSQDWLKIEDDELMEPFKKETVQLHQV